MDLSNCKSDKARQILIRETFAKEIYDHFVEKLSPEDTKLITEKITINDVDFDSQTVFCSAGEVTDKNGYTINPVVQISVRVRSWNDTPKRKAITYGDILDIDES